MIVSFVQMGDDKMILAITKNNENLIYDVCKKSNLGLPQIITGIDSLYKFAVQDLKSLSN